MKFLSKLIILIFIVGLVLTIIAFSSGVNLSNLGSFFVDDESYSDPIEYISTTTIEHLNVDVDTRNIIVSSTSGDSIIVTYRSHEDDIWTLSESAGTLNIIQTTKPFLFNWFNFKFASYDILTVAIEIPESLILNHSIHSATGDIIYSNGLSIAYDMNLETQTGEVELDHIDMDSLSIDLDTGSIHLSYLNVSGDLDANNHTGSINLSHVDANLINLDNHTGRVTGDYVNATKLTGETSTGKVQISHANISGMMDLSSATGNVVITDCIATGYDLSSGTGSVTFTSSTALDLRYDLDTSTGNITVNGDDQGDKHSTSTGSILLKISVSTGNITVSVQN